MPAEDPECGDVRVGDKHKQSRMTTCSVNQFEFSLISLKTMHAQSGELLFVTRKLKQSPAVWEVITIGEVISAAASDCLLRNA